jgi:hypothetical protein
MPSVLQFRRGTTSQNNSFTGAVGEISVDTDINTLRVHDGSTAGGSVLVSVTGTQTLTNKTLTSPTITGVSPTITLGGDLSGSLTLTNLGGGTLTATLTKDPTITLTGDVTGSATMTNLDNVSIATTIAANSVALGTDTTGNYVAAGSTSGNGISGSVSSEGGTFTVTSNATNANTGSTIVFRDASGNFSAGTITATLTGNASTATALATARTIGGVSFNGSADINLPGVNTTGNQNTTGSAATLTTARTIGGVSFNGSADINLPGVNTAGNQNTTGNASTATTATNVTTTDNTAENATMYIAFVDGTSGAQGIEVDSTGLTYNPSTNTLTTTNFAGQATTAKYADLAENYLADQAYPVGTILQIGGVAEVTVAIEKNYGVVGTVSENPGYLMNSELVGEHVTPVAYIGRVPCRVKGIVRRGELLVVSDTPGVAMVRHSRDILPGQLVGKALQEYTNDGEGVIEILVGRL